MLRVYYLDELIIERERREKGIKGEREIERESKKKIKSLLKG